MISETDLHAYVDNQLDAARREEVAAHLQLHPEDATKVTDWQRQKELLHLRYDPVLEEPVGDLPPLSEVPSSHPRAWRMAAAVLVFVLGGVGGWTLRDATVPAAVAVSPVAGSWVQLAAAAHAVYIPEVRHAVEVTADQETHLVRWLTKRLQRKVSIPFLGDSGYQLVGGRLLPGEAAVAAAQFMYESLRGNRLTLYVRPAEADEASAFRYAEENGVSLFYWIDGGLAYALSGELPREELLDLATTVYNQLAL